MRHDVLTFRFHNIGLCAEDKIKKAPKKERGVLPATQMLPIIQSGAQLRVNGNHKFRQGKYKEALEMYMQASIGGMLQSSALGSFRVPVVQTLPHACFVGCCRVAWDLSCIRQRMHKTRSYWTRSICR